MAKNSIALTIIFFCAFSLLKAQNTLYYTEPGQLYSEGLELMEKSNYGAARETFEQYYSVAEDASRKAEAQYYIAFCALTLFHQDGEKLIGDFIAENPNHPKATTAYFELGDFYFQQSSYTKAIHYFEKTPLLEIPAKQRDEARFKLAYAHFTKRQFDEALAGFNVLKRGPGIYAPASNYYAGYIEYQKGENDKAIEDLDRAQEDPAYEAVVPAMLANLYYKQGRYDDLLAYSDKVLNSGTRVNERNFYLLSADANREQGNYNNALRFYERYLASIDNPSPEVEYRIGEAYYKAGMYDEAINHLKQAASDRDEIGIYASYYLGLIYLKEGNKLYAITAFDNARRNDFDQEMAEESFYQYAKLSYDLDRPEEAIEAFTVFLKTYPDSKHTDEVSDLLSNAYLNSNNYNLAISHIESQPGMGRLQQEVYQKATYLKGVDLFNQSNYPAAIDLFDKSLNYPLDKEIKAKAAMWTGEAYSVGRKFEEAIEYYQVAIGTNLPANSPTMLQARYGIGYAYYNTKQYNKALGHFKEYVNQLQNAGDKRFYDDALLRLADCYYIAKQYPGALNYYRKAIQVNKVDNDYARLQTGIVYGLENNVDEAIREFDFVIDNYPGSRYLDNAMFQKAQLTFEQGNYANAAQYFTELIERKPSSQYIPYAYMRRASSNYNLANYDASINDYVYVLQQFSGHSTAGEALLPLQEVLNLQGRSSEFDQYLVAYKQANPENEGLESVEFETAKNQYYNLNYAKAINSFQGYVRGYPENSKVNEAKYYIAESYYRQNEFDKALGYYNELLAQQSFDQRSRVINRIAEIEYKGKRYDNATYFYYQLEDAARTKKEQYYAWSGLMESYYHLGQYDSTTHYAQVILERGNVNISSQNKASLYLGKASYARGDYEAAKDGFINTLNTAKDENGAEAQYLLGLIFFNQGEYRKSIEILIELNSSFVPYKEWVGKSYLLLADNYLALDDKFQARGTLKSIIENFPLEHIKEQARNKLSQIKKEELTEIDTLNNDN